jgi:hypothetical protein
MYKYRSLRCALGRRDRDLILTEAGPGYSFCPAEGGHPFPRHSPPLAAVHHRAPVPQCAR